MFSLENELLKWRRDFTSNENFTEDDVEELEAHILDKISELEKSGLSQEKAYYKALKEMGYINELEEEYGKANIKNKILSKVILGIWGYVSINAVLYIVILLLGIFSRLMISTKNIFWNLKIPIVYDLLKTIYGVNYTRGLEQIIFVISILISIYLVKITLYSKINYVELLVNNINKLYQKSLLNKVIIVIVPTILAAVPIIISLLVHLLSEGITYFNQYMFMVDFSIMVYSLILIICTLINYKKIIEKKYISDFIIGFLTLSSIPSYIMGILAIMYQYTNFLSIGKYIISIMIYTILILIGIQVISKKNYERLKFRVHVFINLCYLGNFLLTPISTRLVLPEQYGEVSNTVVWVNILFFVGVQIMIGILALKKNVNYLSIKQ